MSHTDVELPPHPPDTNTPPAATGISDADKRDAGARGVSLKT